MAKIKVYQCKSWNDREAMWKVNRGFFKREAIDAMTGTHIVPETEREVEESELNENGRVILLDVEGLEFPDAKIRDIVNVELPKARARLHALETGGKIGKRDSDEPSTDLTQDMIARTKAVIADYEDTVDKLKKWEKPGDPV